MLIADYYEERHITEYDQKGEYIRDISCSSDPYYLTLIDPDHIAVTYLSSKNIEIININNAHVQQITLRRECRGISYQDGKIFVSEDRKGITVIDRYRKYLTNTSNRCNKRP